ncbi:hypothetical protein V1511DRAFT_497636 [Dipodascopsis uninucleata]
MNRLLRLATRNYIIKFSGQFNQRFFTSTTRMAAKREFVCILPDKSDALQRRLSVRDSHLANVKKLFADGIMSSGGAYLEGPAIANETPSFLGSVVTLVGDSKEEIIEVLKADPYYTNEVWDWEKVQIYDYLVAVRRAK